MKFSEEYYKSAQQRAQALLFRIPGVVGVALGPKIIAGKLTRTPAIQVYVTEKRPPADVPPEERIPVTFAGVATDVLEGMLPLDPLARPSDADLRLTDAFHRERGLGVDPRIDTATRRAPRGRGRA